MRESNGVGRCEKSRFVGRGSTEFAEYGRRVPRATRTAHAVLLWLMSRFADQAMDVAVSWENGPISTSISKLAAANQALISPRTLAR